jgi:hypothetical protein
MSSAGSDELGGGAAFTPKRARSDKPESPPRFTAESLPRPASDVFSSEDTKVSVSKTPPSLLPVRRGPSEEKKPPLFLDDYELGVKLKEAAVGQAYICYAKIKFQGGKTRTFREKKFVVKLYTLEDVSRHTRGSFWTWEKLLRIKRGQSEIMMANVHKHIVRHLGSYEDEERHEL